MTDIKDLEKYTTVKKFREVVIDEAKKGKGRTRLLIVADLDDGTWGFTEYPVYATVVHGLPQDGSIMLRGTTASVIIGKRKINVCGLLRRNLRIPRVMMKIHLFLDVGNAKKMLKLDRVGEIRSDDIICLVSSLQLIHMPLAFFDDKPAGLDEALSMVERLAREVVDVTVLCFIIPRWQLPALEARGYAPVAKWGHHGLVVAKRIGEPPKES